VPQIDQICEEVFYKIPHQALVQEEVAKQDHTIELLCLLMCIING